MRLGGGYQDEASPQPRTNCAMGLYKDGALFGVSTIDINLGFFNSLIQDKEKKVQGQIMIVERDGKILTNQNTILRSLSGSNLYQQEYEDPQNGDLTFFLKIMPGTPWRVRDCPAHCVADFAQQ